MHPLTLVEQPDVPSQPSTKICQSWARVREALRPPPQLPLSTWLEQTVRLPHGLAAEGGPLHLWPTQRGIADALTDPALERITLVKAARCGFTSLLTGLIGHHCSNDPEAILPVLATEFACRDHVARGTE